MTNILDFRYQHYVAERTATPYQDRYPKQDVRPVSVHKETRHITSLSTAQRAKHRLVTPLKVCAEP